MAQLESHPEWIARATEILARSDLAAEMLSRHPEEVAVLADPGLAGFRGPLRAMSGADVENALAAVRVGYRRGVLATVVRALFGVTQPFETFQALTRLAEEALGHALELAAREVLGTVDLASGPLAVLALGRLGTRSEEHTSELQSRLHLVCRLLLEKKKKSKRGTTRLSAPHR